VKYQFGLFDDTRVHGVPASGIAMVSCDGARFLFDQRPRAVRFDLFLDQAWGRDDPGHGPWQPR
jgi:hypothetical protein